MKKIKSHRIEAILQDVIEENKSLNNQIQEIKDNTEKLKELKDLTENQGVTQYIKVLNICIEKMLQEIYSLEDIIRNNEDFLEERMKKVQYDS